MNKNITYFVLAALTVVSLSACTQTTPSMMNTSRVELARETSVEQIPLKEITDVTMSALAEQYRKHGNGPLDLSMTYDPKAKDFTAMRAVHELKHIQTALRKKGLTNISMQTIAVPDGKPSLMVSFDMVRAQAPSDCTPMPGLHSNETGRDLGNYKFGCGLETAFSKQIARPSDLEGNTGMGTRSARRSSIIVEGYSSGIPREPLNGIERGDIGAE